MRLMAPKQSIIACQLTGRFGYNHGAPLHLGNPEAIGIKLKDPIVGPPLDDIPNGMVPVFGDVE